jgi:hypothetical protein
MWCTVRGDHMEYVFVVSLYLHSAFPGGGGHDIGNLNQSLGPEANIASFRVGWNYDTAQARRTFVNILHAFERLA